uniref:Uncharacterized protein n=1 Tax=Fagus sylvatica TaxID=28930 RepID=A0A2N9FID7_FAGSY
MTKDHPPVVVVVAAPPPISIPIVVVDQTSMLIEINPPMQALLATPQQALDPNWYPNTGASHHVTHELANLNLRPNEYQGTDQIRVGSGYEASSVAWAK